MIWMAWIIIWKIADEHGVGAAPIGFTLYT
jgi:hypothetical protein